MESNDPGFLIDQDIVLNGIRAHFFTSRPLKYLGYNLFASGESPRGEYWGIGMFFMMGGRQTDYWLNWEIPDAGALDPIRTSLKAWYLEVGPTLRLGVGPVVLQPLVGLSSGRSEFLLEFQNHHIEDDYTVFGGLSCGGQAAIVLKPLVLSVGYKATRIFSNSPKFDVEPQVAFKGKYDGYFRTLFFGIGLTADD